MRFIFKTDYGAGPQARQARRPRVLVRPAVPVAAAAPWLLSEYWLAQLTFMMIYGIVGLGLMLLAGFTGLFSIGHAAFFGVGAYTQAVLTGMGWPFPLALAAPRSVGRRGRGGRPAGAAREGIYLGIATLSFGFIVEEVFARWESVTGGNAGKTVGPGEMFGWTAGSGDVVLLSSAWWSPCWHAGQPEPAALAHRPRLRGDPRFGDLGAEHGHPPGALQDAVFALSAALAGMGGALYAHKIRFISPDQFNILQSIDLLLMVVIGGLGSVHGAFLGAIFLIGCRRRSAR
jgi:branched-chain amino acid transport system permease protein